MKKKAYISPALQVVKLNNEQPIMALSTFDEAATDSTVLSKGNDDWDIWGNGSDSDYEDDY